MTTDTRGNSSMSVLYKPAPQLGGRRSRRRTARRGSGLHGLAGPHLPRGVAAGRDAVELDLVLERVHRAPEPVVGVCQQPLRLDEPGERLDDELLARVHVLEDLSAQGEE